MRVFVLQLVAFVALQATIGAFLWSALEANSNSYFAATVDKHNRLEAEPEKRVLFAGGSNLAFGMDSPRVSKALGRPVVNLGLHAALGYKFILSEVETVAREGDVVVLSLEYPHFGTGMVTQHLFDLLEQRPASYSFVAWEDVPTLLDTATIYFGGAMRRAVDNLRGDSEFQFEPPYDRSSFNELGDAVAHRDLPRKPKGGTTTLNKRWRPEILDVVLGELNAFEARLRHRGVEVLYTHPPISEEAVELIAKGTRELHRALVERTTMTVLDTPEEACLPREVFYDTAFHLSGEGTRRRVDRLIPLLREHIH